MSAQRDVIAAWQLTLETAFSTTPLLTSLQRAEGEHSHQIAQRGCGFATLMRCYQEFALQTLDEVPRHGHVLNVYNVALNTAAIKRFRAVFHAYDAGYYFDAASGIRTILEITMYLAAVLKGYFGFDRVHEFGRDLDLESPEFRDIKRHKGDHDRRLSSEVGRKIYGDQSGLSPEEIEQIGIMHYVHHSHVHRGESNMDRAILEMLESRQMPRITPTLDLKLASIFCNPAVLAAWTHTRVLPYLSLPDRFSEGWTKRFNTLDRALRQYVDLWEKTLPKQAFISLIDKSFSFDDTIAQKQVSTQATNQDRG